MNIGSPQHLLLIPEKKKRDIGKCILCQCVKDSKGSNRLTSTEDGRSKVIDASRYLQDDVLSRLSEDEFTSIMYHVKTCYANYIRSKKKADDRQTQPVESSDEDVVHKSPEPSYSRPKRPKK